MMVKSLSKLLYASLFLALSFILVACSSPKDSVTKSSSSDKVSKSRKSSHPAKLQFLLVRMLQNQAKLVHPVLALRKLLQQTPLFHQNWLVSGKEEVLKLRRLQ